MEALLELLADGEFHAGDELGARLNISRAAIWKQIHKLGQMGVEVQSIKGKGYRLLEPLELLKRDSILGSLPAGVRGLLNGLELLYQTTSTNDVAMALASRSAGSGMVVLAEQQTAGRGRRGRPWVSPFGCNLYLSVVWEFFQGAAALEGLSLAAGVAVVRALKATGVTEARLKWPNDILVDDKKISGILLEMTGDPCGRCQVVLGAGVNHKISRTAAIEIDQPWCRLDDLNPGISRNQLAAAVISELLGMLDCFQREGFSAFRDEWESLDRYRGAQVQIRTGAHDIVGMADGVDSTGGLRLLTEQGMQIIKGGEMSLRPTA